MGGAGRMAPQAAIQLRLKKLDFDFDQLPLQLFDSVAHSFVPFQAKTGN